MKDTATVSFLRTTKTQCTIRIRNIVVSYVIIQIQLVVNYQGMLDNIHDMVPISYSISRAWGILSTVFWIFRAFSSFYAFWPLQPFQPFQSLDAMLWELVFGSITKALT